MLLRLLEESKLNKNNVPDLKYTFLNLNCLTSNVVINPTSVKSWQAHLGIVWALASLFINREPFEPDQFLPS